MSDKKKLVAFTILGSPRTYIGEYAGTEAGVLSIDRCIIFMMNLGKDKQVETHCGPVEFGSRDSRISINTNVVPGILLDHPDPELVSVYEKEVMASYSKLTLV